MYWNRADDATQGNSGPGRKGAQKERPAGGPGGHRGRVMSRAAKPSRADAGNLRGSALRSLHASHLARSAHPPDGVSRPIGECLDELRRAGWSVGDSAFTGERGALSWVVTGSNGENLIRASGPTRAVAWLAACGQVRAMGMLGRRPMPSDGRG
jgi:hypothetical protein